MNYTFKGNFGTLELVVDDNGTASGTYQKGGTLSGTYKDGEFEGEWENNELNALGYQRKRPGGFLQCYEEAGITLLNESIYNHKVYNNT